MNREDLPHLVYSYVNGFHNFYQDAEVLLEIAKKVPDTPGIAFQKTILSRTAILLYIISLEALINRVAANFLASDKQEEFLYKQKNKYRSFKSKWLDFPQFLSETSQPFNGRDYPWNQFIELIQIRNDYAHFKDDRLVFYAMYPKNHTTF